MKTICIYLYIALAELVILSPAIYGSDNNLISSTQSNQNSIGVNIGINDFHMKDKYISPLIYRGINFSSRLYYINSTEKSQHNITLYFSNGNIESDKSFFDVTQYIGSLSYTYFYKIDDTEFAGHPVELSLGGGISTFAAMTDLIIPNGNDATWIWNQNLNIHLKIDYYFSENNSLSFTTLSPVLYFSSRPKNGHDLAESNNWEAWDKNLPGKVIFIWQDFQMTTQVEYRQRLHKNLNMTMNYSFSFVSSDKPLNLPLSMYMNNFLLGCEWLF